MTFLLLVMLGFFGRGTVIEHDCGYDGWRTDPVTGKLYQKHTPIPTRIALVGISDRELSEACRPHQIYLVFCKEGEPLAGGSVLLSLWEVPLREVKKVKHDHLVPISIDDVEVKIRKR